MKPAAAFQRCQVFLFLFKMLLLDQLCQLSKLLLLLLLVHDVVLNPQLNDGPIGQGQGVNVVVAFDEGGGGEQGRRRLR